MTGPLSWQSQIVVDHSSIRPLYVQVKEALEDWILHSLHGGQLSPGDRLPSENELSEQLNVSTITVKRALDELRRQGLIRRIQGRGSFVSPQKMILPLPRLFSLTEFTREYGMRPVRHTIEISEITSPTKVAHQLALSEKQHVVKLVRQLNMDENPIAVDTSYLPLHIFPDLLTKYNDQVGLYATLEEYYQLEVVRAVDIFEPVLISPFESKILETPAGSLGIALYRTGFGKADLPLEVTRSVFRGDLCSFSIEFSKETE